MTSVAIIGYASLDHVVRLEGPPLPDATVIAARPAGAWPRLGGSPSYIAAALIRAGIARAVPVTWVAQDEAGAHFVASLAAGGMPVDGVARSLGGRTPVCILAYAPDGACFCLYDPGESRRVGLAEFQGTIVDAADWICVTVGSPMATRAVLARLRPDQRLAWVVKADGDAFPPALRAALAARAELIVCSRGERPFVADALVTAPARTGRIVVETHGAEGALVTAAGGTVLIVAETLAAADPTGAGDTFVGGMLAALIASPGNVAGAVRAGQRAAREMLAARIKEG